MSRKKGARLNDDASNRPTEIAAPGLVLKSKWTTKATPENPMIVTMMMRL
jgi:hypothetical protein